MSDHHAIPDAPIPSNPQPGSLDITWNPVESAAAYELHYRKVPEDWKDATVVPFTVEEYDAKVREKVHTVTGLQDTSTYQFKIVAIFADGNKTESSVVTFDTMVANCGPSERCCCTIC